MPDSPITAYTYQTGNIGTHFSPELSLYLMIAFLNNPSQNIDFRLRKILDSGIWINLSLA
jgi:hypothetical protein